MYMCMYVVWSMMIDWDRHYHRFRGGKQQLKNRSHCSHGAFHCTHAVIKGLPKILLLTPFTIFTRNCPCSYLVQSFLSVMSINPSSITGIMLNDPADRKMGHSFPGPVGNRFMTKYLGRAMKITAGRSEGTLHRALTPTVSSPPYNI